MAELNSTSARGDAPRRCIPRSRSAAQLIPLIALAVHCLATSHAVGEEPKARRAWVVGTDKSFWVVTSTDTTGPSLPIVRMLHGMKDSEGLPHWQSSLFLTPISGDAINLGADTESLRILFSDLSQRDYFTDREATPGPPWSDQCRSRPLAWAGDATQAVFYALVQTGDLPPLTTSEAEPEDESRPTSLPAMPSTALTLLRLRNGFWQRQAGPADAADGFKYWLAGRDNHPAVFWSTGTHVRVTARNETGWTPSKDVAHINARHAWAGDGPSGLVFVAAEGESTPRMQLRLFLEHQGTWRDAGLLRDGPDPLVVDPRRCSVAVACNSLAVARPTTDGSAEFGLGELGATPLVRFSNLPQESSIAPRSEWEGVIVFAALLGAITIVLWTRRGSIAALAQLPAGWAMAAVWKRILATVIDFVPATLILLPWMLPIIIEAELALDFNPLRRQMEDPSLQARLAPILYATTLVYGLWCFLWEVFAATTPGKHLFACRVISVDGTRPNFRQVLVRNLVRVVMVGLGSPGLILTLMMIMFVSRNRQHAGDLLANTLVVEPARDEGPADEDFPP